jgi:hypothetical protein
MLWIDPGWADEIAYLGRSQRPGGRAPDASTNTVAAHETPWEANGFILARRPRTRSAERAPCNDTSDFLRIDGRPVDQASRSDRDPYSPVIPRTPDGWSRSNSNPLTPTLPATRSKVFEHSRKCENPFYIRGFGKWLPRWLPDDLAHQTISSGHFRRRDTGDRAAGLAVSAFDP